MSETVEEISPEAEAEAAPQAPKGTPHGIGVLGWLRWGWRQLTSMRTALVLLFILALGSVPGSFLPQQGTNPTAVTQFMTRHATLGPLLNRFSLFDVFAAPWYVGIYVLLVISLAGCVFPRCWHHFRLIKARPPAAPRNLARLPQSTTFETGGSPEEAIAQARAVLRRRRFRVDTDDETARAEKGHLRETGNLVFHLALLLLLFMVAFGSVEGYTGNVVVTEGDGFSNSLTSYDAFKPGRIFNAANLPPFVVWLDKFDASYIEQGSQRGQPLKFDADIRYKSSLTAPIKHYDLRTNEPLKIDGTRVYLLGHGYAPVFTVRDGHGQVAFQGAVPFLPSNASTFQSEGVIKVPDAHPTQLGFLGVFLPSAVPDGKGNGVVSIFPAPDNPLVTLIAYKGNLGVDSGVPQSVYQLDTDQMTKLGIPNKPLAVGSTVKLPGGVGSITYDGYKQWISVQVTHDPGGSLALFACGLAILAIITSFAVRRRRVWVRATSGEAGRTVVEVGGLTLGGETAEFDDIADELKTTISTEE